jgi:uncharacterized protein YukE
VSDSDSVSAAPEHLAAAAKQVGFHTDEVSAAHGTLLERLETSYGGWVGQSAGALDGVGTSWRAATQHHVGRLDALNDHLRRTIAGPDGRSPVPAGREPLVIDCTVKRP